MLIYERRETKIVQVSIKVDKERCGMDVWTPQNKWCIIKHPTRLWDMTKLTKVITACVNLHNMIIKRKGIATFMYCPNHILNPTYFTRRLKI